MEKEIAFNNMGNEACDESLDGDCDNCEFKTSRKTYRKPDFEYCEKGFWRVET